MTAAATPWADLIRSALLSGVDPAEARIAAALKINPELKGTRPLEAASGLSRTLVCRTVPDVQSELLTTLDRGSSDWAHPRPMEISVRDRHFVVHQPPISSSQPKDSPGEGLSLVLSGSNLGSTNRAGAREDCLDPALDLWSDSPQATSYPDGRAGTHGWVLAVVYGLSPVEVPLTEVRELLRLAPKGLQMALRRLESAGWVSRQRKGRSWTVTVDFSFLADSFDGGVFIWRDRQYARADSHRREGVKLIRRRTKLGLRAWLTTLYRAERLVGLPAGPWRDLVESGSEEQIHEWLVEAAKPPPPPEPVHRPASDPEAFFRALAALA